MNKFTNRWELVPSVSVKYDVVMCDCLPLGLFGMCFGDFAEQTQRSAF